MNQKISLAVFLLLVSLNSFAQFIYERKISDVPVSGWYRISIPAEVLPKLNSDFSDLRIYSALNDTTEIPYLLNIAEDRVTRKAVISKPFNVSQQGDALYFTVKSDRNEPINQATIEFAQDNYDSEVTVEGSNNQQQWFKIHTGRVISVVNAPIHYTYNHLTFPASTYTYLRFVVHHGARLTLGKVNFYQLDIMKGVFDETPSSLSSKIINKQSEFYLTFDQPVLLSRLSIEPIANQQFYRNVAIDWLYDSITSEKGKHYQYQSLYSGVISSFQQDTLQFTPRVVKQLRLTIFNLDNLPVNINKIITWAPRVDLIAFMQPGAFTLKYGNSKTYKPNYDIQHFSKEIPDTLTSLQVSSELKPQQIPPSETTAWFKNKLWMWGILAVIVLILGFFTMRMMRE